MVAILEGHTQALSRISRDATANDDTVYLSLSLLDIMCPRGWRRDREAIDDMPRWTHERTGAGQWDFPNLMEFVVTTKHGHPLQPSKMDDWSSTGKIWAHLNCTMETLTHLLLQQHPLGSLTDFRNNSMVALQQHSPQGIALLPHFFNYGDTEGDIKSRSLINRAAGLQMTGVSRHSRHPLPCKNPDSHPARSGIAQRPELLNELVRSTSLTLTIYTILYPQGHAGLQGSGHPSVAIPFLFDRGDTSPVYRSMYQTFSVNLQDTQLTEASSEPRHTPAALATVREGDKPIPFPRYRTIWASSQGSGEDALKWQRVILIQNSKDQGFTHAQIRAGPGSVRTWGNEEYKGHV